ncbi:MAG: hypothetical protein KME19_12455 [Microcoleus vaginatus WJT46-NPBG5]|nr:hypothetical protein [Microcoleus vaginatus WJT46-NPBG5]
MQKKSERTWRLVDAESIHQVMILLNAIVFIYLSRLLKAQSLTAYGFYQFLHNLIFKIAATGFF